MTFLQQCRDTRVNIRIARGDGVLAARHHDRELAASVHDFEVPEFAVQHLLEALGEFARNGDTAMTCHDPSDAPTGSVVAVTTVIVG